MKVTDFNREVNLLEIVNKNKADQNQSVDKKAESFKETFSKEIARTNNVNFSKHAQQRLFSRGIEMTDQKLDQLSQAIDKAAGKGSKDTLILDDNAAYVASVPTRTIITAFSRTNLQEGVFTSIDSAVIL
ncbi:MAG TPA: flagellar protein [candidate division Zixibacteria bacterium]|nr:flagellar protein [candidate division Zixibacteria bacterium]